MSLKIAILEDNADRRDAMCARLGERFPQYEICCFAAAQPMLEWLSGNLSQTLVISLDHDLEVASEVGRESIDPGTGREVADYLAAQMPQCHVVIHRTNVPAAIGMECALQEAGWKTSRTTPYDDLEWIGREWFSAICEAITRSTETLAMDVEEPKRREAVEDFLRISDEIGFNSGGDRLKRDELHERR